MSVPMSSAIEAAMAAIMEGITAEGAAAAWGIAAGTALGAAGAAVRLQTQLISVTSRMMHKSHANTVPRPIRTTNRLE